MRGVIVLAGQAPSPDLLRPLCQAADLVLCADGGLAAMERAEVWPDAWLGDGDSCDPEQLKALREKGIECIAHPVHKDATDGELCLREALDRGCDEILFLGGFGGESDHFLGNLSLLYLCGERGVEAAMIDEYTRVQVMGPGKHIVPGVPGARLSLTVLAPTGFRDCSGLYYPLPPEILPGSSHGLSNKMTDGIARFTVEHGRCVMTVTVPKVY